MVKIAIADVCDYQLPPPVRDITITYTSWAIYWPVRQPLFRFVLVDGHGGQWGGWQLAGWGGIAYRIHYAAP